jgi:ribosomal-protein-alanine N-acetyltransferase
MVEEARYIIRPVRDGDISQIIEIDREAFAGEYLFHSYSSYQREIHNSSAHYIAACLGEEREPNISEQIIPSVPWHKRLFSHDHHNGEYSHSEQYILGFAGLWIAPDEGHIIAIGVRSNYRRIGIGEKLLISLIDFATQSNFKTITLEVRVSNEAAQSLYQKYGFHAIGRHHRYYSNNGEDALLMSTDTITSAPFQAHFQQLKEIHRRRWNGKLVTA